DGLRRPTVLECKAHLDFVRQHSAELRKQAERAAVSWPEIEPGRIKSSSALIDPVTRALDSAMLEMCCNPSAIQSNELREAFYAGNRTKEYKILLARILNHLPILLGIRTRKKPLTVGSISKHLN